MAEYSLQRREVMAELLADRGDALMVAGLGSPVWDLAAVDHRDENFYVWGGMGGAAMIGLGIALSQPERKVWVVTGDGEALMGMGSLATIAAQKPENLAVIVFDNEHYGETGMQPTVTGGLCDLPAIAKGAGIATSVSVVDQAGVGALKSALADGPYPLFANIKVHRINDKPVLPPRDGVYSKHRFRVAVLGERSAMHPY
ncbi:MAG: aldehyde dehydrogenase [Rhodospirillaceae bacterium]|jgi:thiamine pyrophosphate-dependent acetolactate synthase large subunit-like protein|nr:aldehyde dehydrogenase [Rhodospirillaceae bacterium]MBT6139258.1 aldehyde dehydrogenase [Rhodospirillaceae bacterium]